jgi:hypothetical protein
MDDSPNIHPFRTLTRQNDGMHRKSMSTSAQQPDRGFPKLRNGVSAVGRDEAGGLVIGVRPIVTMPEQSDVCSLG